MNLIKYIVLIILLFINFTGCTNQNELSLGKIDDKEIVKLHEKDYKEILVDKILISDTNEQMKQWLFFKTNSCIKEELSSYAYTYNNERFSTSDWFEITDENLVIEYNLRNIIKDKKDLENEELKLGGTQGNKMFRIKLPYKIIKQKDKDYRFILNNSENVELIKSISLKTNKPFEETLYNKSLEVFKIRINYLAKCMQKNN
jgi:hypothetical protein